MTQLTPLKGIEIDLLMSNNEIFYMKERLIHILFDVNFPDIQEYNTFLIYKSIILFSFYAWYF